MLQHRVTSGSINGPEAITNLAYIMSYSTGAWPAVTSQVDSMYCPVCRHLLLVIYGCTNPRPAPAVQTQLLQDFCSLFVLFSGSRKSSLIFGFLSKPEIKIDTFSFINAH